MNLSRVVIFNILALVVIVGGGFLGYYFINQSSSYVSTDNAHIDGQPITIYALSSGQVTSWNGEVGKTFQAGDKLGTIQGGVPSNVASAPASTGSVAVEGSAPAQVSLTVPTRATIVQQNVVPNSVVAAGTPLARAYDMSNLWVTANVKETDINDVKTGQDVDVYVDAFPGSVLRGKVDKIGLATSNTFSLLPNSNTSGNYTKVTQVIPVTISLVAYGGLNIVPGMSTTVRIHK